MHPDELARYSRHLLLPDVGVAGQERLSAARVLVVGAGGLGSPVALYLAAAGVGTLGLVDFDVVDVSNLQRQILHGTSDIGRTKLDSARDRLRDVNPHVLVQPHATQLTSANAIGIIERYDIVVDGTDNFATRYLVNDACVLLGRPNVYGSIFRFEGQASVFGLPDGPCYRCLFPEPPPPGAVPSCAEGGVLGVLPGLVGTIQATEVLKLVLGIGEGLSGRLLLVDALTMTFRTVRLRRDPACPACGTREITGLIDYEQFCGIATHASGDGIPEVEPIELSARIRAGESPQLLDVREPAEWNLSHLDGAKHVPLGRLEEYLSRREDDVGRGKPMFTQPEAIHPPLDRAREVVVMCRSGQRSARAAEMLKSAGFRDVRNLAGGLARWRRDVDPSLPL